MQEPYNSIYIESKVLLTIINQRLESLLASQPSEDACPTDNPKPPPKY